MKAAVVHSFTEPLRIEDVPIPEPGPGEIVVRVETSGLCHTDIHAAHGDWPIKPSPPFIPGHEGVAFGCLRRHGRLVFVGLPAENRISLPIFETVLQGISVTGSIVGTRVDLAETYELHADGRTTVVRESRKLEQVNESIAEVLSGQVPARLVFDLR